jgi:hypothetical protein
VHESSKTLAYCKVLLRSLRLFEGRDRRLARLARWYGRPLCYRSGKVFAVHVGRSAISEWERASVRPICGAESAMKN